MSRSARVAVALAVMLVEAPPLRAQQGSLQVTSANQLLAGSALRIGTLPSYEPDVRLDFVQSDLFGGTFVASGDLAERHGRARPGRATAGVRDLKLGGFRAVIFGGDTAISPLLSEFGFTNLFAPDVTLRGVTARAESSRTSVSVTAGRVTALRGIFGADAERLHQSVTMGRISHRAADRVTVFARLAHTSTTDLSEFTWTVQSSTTAGGGVDVRTAGDLHLIADVATTGFRRRGSPLDERQTSVVVGPQWRGSRGFLQANYHRFAAGYLPALNFPYNDRNGVFVGGEYHLARALAVFGGYDRFRTNLAPERSALGSVPVPDNDGHRGFAGVRLLAGASTLSVRVEDGTRGASLTRPVASVSRTDTGLVNAEWQARLLGLNTVARYERRANVDTFDLAGTFTQHDFLAQIFRMVSSSTQIYGGLSYSHRGPSQCAATPGRGEQSFWQGSGGGSFSVLPRGLALRLEGTISRNLDVGTSLATPRQAATVGVSGQLVPGLTLSADYFLDRSPLRTINTSPFVHRLMLRVGRQLRWGQARPSGVGAVPLRRARGAGSLGGVVFADLNGNGARDPGESGVGGTVILLDGRVPATSDGDGRYVFTGVPAGEHRIEVDLKQLPVDYDPPVDLRRTLEVRNHETATAEFGVIPVGSIAGTIAADTNGNGEVDAGDLPLNDVVVVLDGGARSERTSGGAFRFDGVRLGAHRVQVLVETLPELTTLTGAAEIEVTLDADTMDRTVSFLAKAGRRPEIRKVFPPKPPQ